MSHDDNIYWQQGRLDRQQREQLAGHQGVCVWLTGLSGSGKTSIARELEGQLYQREIRTFMLDGDNVRHGLCRDLGFSPEDRDENIRRVGEVAELFVEAANVVVASFISPYRAQREAIRESMDEGRFVEIHVQCPLEVCEERDPKGLYEQARNGEIENFTGIDAPYEAPDNPELRIDTSEDDDATVSADRIVTYLEDGAYLTL